MKIKNIYNKKRVEELMKGMFAQFLLYFMSILFMEFILANQFDIPFFVRKIIYTAGFSLVFAGITSLIPNNNIRRVCNALLLFVLTFLYVAEAVYYKAFYQVALIKDLSNLRELAGVKGTIGDFLSWNLLWFLLPFIVYIISIIAVPRILKAGAKIKKDKSESKKSKRSIRMRKLKKSIRMRESERSMRMNKNKKSRRMRELEKEKWGWKVSIIFIFSGIFIISGINIYYTHINIDNNKVSSRNTTLYFKQYGLLETASNDILHQIFPVEKTENLTLESKVEELAYLPEPNEMTDIYKGKNLIFIEGESIAPYAIDPILTPTLYKLKNEGTYFSNYYSARPNTVNSEYAILTSSYMTDDKAYAAHADTMPTLFGDESYTTSSFHNNEGWFYDREVRMPILGFQTHYASEQLGTKPSSNTDYASDVDLFKNSFQYLSLNTEPFFSYFITISAHSAYRIDARPSLQTNMKVVKQVYPDYDESLQTYLAGAMETDQGVAELLNYLEQHDLLDNTVIAIAGDHYPYALDGKMLAKQYDLGELEKHKVPFLIWDSSKPSTENTDLMTNIDILPTLSNMFDLKLKYALGKDIYSSNKNDVMVDWFDFRSYSFLTPEGGYDGEEDEIIGNLTLAEVAELQEKSYERYELISDPYTLEKMKK